MDIGLIGLGKMGMGLLRRWQAAGHTVTGFDISDTARVAAQSNGAVIVETLEELVASLTPPRVLWIMVPPGEPVAQTIEQLANRLDPDDTVLDGGNTHYQASQRHALKMGKRGIHFLDVGVSGGVQGEHAGYALMVGGEEEAVATIKPLLTALQGPDALAHVGPAGAGHFVKMVHNAVEYGMLQAMAEGFDLLKNGPYTNLDVPGIAELWSHGTIVRSFLMELAAQALRKNPELKDIQGYVNDSGEGRWATEAAVAHAVPFWVNSAALYARFASRQNDSFANQVIAALRQEFGGHATKKKE
jgi:6-phosphogluconate dehydrogenase